MTAVETSSVAPALLLPAAEAAKLLSISERHFYKLHASGGFIVEGTLVEREAVIGAGVVLTASTAILDVSGPEVVEHREGGDPSTSRKSPGRTKYDAITLERGVTNDVEFEQWANKVWNFGSGLGAVRGVSNLRACHHAYRCW